uniref:(northern house mosquito) hypothetical protein n=1 Tax=Culex pipiens TaxID=7175 RepID=A0A8D8KC17_CULPI
MSNTKQNFTVTISNRIHINQFPSRHTSLLRLRLHVAILPKGAPVVKLALGLASPCLPQQLLHLLLDLQLVLLAVPVLREQLLVRHDRVARLAVVLARRHPVQGPIVLLRRLVQRFQDAFGGGCALPGHHATGHFKLFEMFGPFQVGFHDGFRRNADLANETEHAGSVNAVGTFLAQNFRINGSGLHGWRRSLEYGGGGAVTRSDLRRRVRWSGHHGRWSLIERGSRRRNTSVHRSGRRLAVDRSRWHGVDRSCRDFHRGRGR